MTESKSATLGTNDSHYFRVLCGCCNCSPVEAVLDFNDD